MVLYNSLLFLTNGGSIFNFISAGINEASISLKILEEFHSEIIKSPKTALGLLAFKAKDKFKNHHFTKRYTILGDPATIVPVNLTSIKFTSEKPESFMLNQNYPNPFNPSTKIKF